MTSPSPISRNTAGIVLALALLASVLLADSASAALTVSGAELYGHSAGGHAGMSVAAAGDVNGDGIKDVIVGAPLTTSDDTLPQRSENGEAFVLFGPFAPTDKIELGDDLGARGFRIIGGDQNGTSKIHLGTSVAGIGDINGDGYADVAVTAVTGSSAMVADSGGYAAVIYGGKSMANVDVKTIGTRGYVTYLPSSSYQRVYANVSPAGDVNGDGLADFMISDPQYYDHDTATCTECSRGDVYVEFGNTTSPGTLSARSLGGNGFYILGANTQSDLGASMAPAGDLNGDGIGDLLLGEPGCLPNVVTPCSSGIVEVLWGTKSVPATVTMPPTALTGFRVEAPPISGGMGLSVAQVGDVNGDGRADLLMGMPFANSKVGRAYVFFTPEHPPTKNDLGAPGAPAVQIDGAATGDMLGAAVAPAGDVDGDGFADVAVAAPDAGSSNGSTYVLRDLHAPGVRDLSLALPSSSGYELSSPTPGQLGTSIADLGDIDADGRDDLLLGGPLGDPLNSVDNGFAFLQTVAPLPSVVTGGASAITATGAAVAAGVLAAGQDTTVRFDFGTTPALGSQSAPVSAGAGSSLAPVSVTLSGLTGATTYSYRAVAVNPSGTVFGKVKTFTTAPSPAATPPPDLTPTPVVKDTVAPRATITTPRCRSTHRKCRKARARRATWRRLRGRVTDASPSSGILRVEVAAVRRRGRHCRAFRGHRFARISCKAKPVYAPAKVVSGRWTITLTGLPKGTVRLAARAVDRAGNVQKPVAKRTLRLAR